ncbi:MAG: NAD(P)-binding domain-containing protein [Rickettsiales bacterium]|jgi:L-lactate dehydrogenase|nr:NAD(P)-binding domain-containing protein [Rickettsiales bacterium]
MKIGIVGAGSVGGAIARDLMNTGLVSQIVLFDLEPEKSQAVAEDLTHASVFGGDITIQAGQYGNFKGADIVIITAGAKQKPGESRTELVERNARNMLDIVPKLMAVVDPNKVILVPVTNPLDVMTQIITQISGLPATRVIGTGTLLDSARFRSLLSKLTGVSHKSIHSFVVGEHGDSEVLNWSGATVGSVPLEDFCIQAKIPLTPAVMDTITHKTVNAAYSIIRGRNATWDGIGAAAAELVGAIITDAKKLLPTSILTAGFLEEPVAFSLPRIIGRDGVIETIYPKMNSFEAKQLRHSAKKILELYNEVR